MTKPKNEAERLLNTIVSSRARLAAIRGDSVGSVEPSVEGDQERSTEAVVESASPFDTLPNEDEHTDFSEPPLILGLEESSSEGDAEIEWTEPAEPPLNDMTQPETHDRQPPVPTPAPEAFPVVDEQWSEEGAEDPFSFIDLIPPAPPEEDTPAPPSEEHLTTPPPVRERPLMPLPADLASCAPQSDLPPVISQDIQPAPAPPRTEEPTSAAALSQPRQVAPRLLDPDRARLEVDVFVDELDDDAPLRFEAEVPQLTAPSEPAPEANAPTHTPDATTLFEAISTGMERLRQGNIHAALAHLSDVLDWDPSQIEARLARGRCRRDLGDTAGAMSDFIISLDHAPHSPEPHVEMGDLFYARKEYPRAIVHYDDALAIQPDHAMALCRRGICHHNSRRPGQAIEDLQQAALADPSIPNIDRYIRMVSPRR